MKHLVAAALLAAPVIFPAASAGVDRRGRESVALATVRPGDIAAGSDGNLWFPEMGTDRVARMTTSGLISEFPVAGASALGRVIAGGPDGKLWVAGFGADGRAHVWAVATSGVSGNVAVLADRPAVLGFLPAGITVGPDRNVWMVDLAQILRISPAGQLAAFPTDDAAFATSITSAPDGNLWFVESIGPFAARRRGLARMNTRGVIEQVITESRQALSTPSSIITGPDGNLWFADNGYGEIVQVTINPLRATSIPFNGASQLAPGPDGNIWATVPARRSIARVTPAGDVTEFELPTTLSIPAGITAGPDRNLWFSEPDNGIVGRITSEGRITEFAVGAARPVPIQAIRSTRVVADR